MSYILEALKKSQRDRELGQVPTLESEPFTEPYAHQGNTSQWLYVAVVLLALVAIAVSLYAVLSRQNGLQQAATVATMAGPATRTTQLPPAEPLPLTTPQRQPETQQPGGLRRIPLESQARALNKPPISQPNTLQESDADSHIPQKAETGVLEMGESVASSAPVLDQDQKRDAMARKMSSEQSTASAMPDQPGKSHTDQSQDQQLTLTLSRETEALGDRREQPSAPGQTSEKAEDGLKSMAKAITTPIAQPRKQINQAQVSQQPRPQSPPYPLAYQLPPEIARSIPSLAISVYYYTDDPVERFVILNSDRRQEGERTADGLLIKEIRDDGLIMEFKGEIFFRPR